MSECYYPRKSSGSSQLECKLLEGRDCFIKKKKLLSLVPNPQSLEDSKNLTNNCYRINPSNIFFGGGFFLSPLPTLPLLFIIHLVLSMLFPPSWNTVLRHTCRELSTFLPLLLGLSHPSIILAPFSHQWACRGLHCEEGPRSARLHSPNWVSTLWTLSTCPSRVFSPPPHKAPFYVLTFPIRI